MPRCTLIVTGAPLTRRCPDISAALLSAGYGVEVVATPSASAWLDREAIEATAGMSPRDTQRRPDQPKRSPLPDVVVVCPATFNTIAKASLGLADTYAHGLLCECLGAAIPTVIVPMINQNLWGHESLADHLQRLSRMGVTFISVASGEPRPAAVASGTGDVVVARFDPGWLVSHLAHVLPIAS